MKYVEFDQETQAYRWDGYFDYLRSNRQRFPAALYEFASDWNRYCLDSPDSLHDSWVRSIQLLGGVGRQQVERVVLTFLGAYHDRIHILSYDGVLDFTIRLAGEASRDLIAHEFAVNEDTFTHELVFAGQQAILVRFSSFTYELELVRMEHA